LKDLKDGDNSIVAVYTETGRIQNRSDLYVQKGMLCTDCEKNISILESNSGRIFKKMYNKDLKEYFSIKGSDYGFSNIVLTRNNEMFCLFILSLIWRVSASKYFERFVLPTNVEKELRYLLLKGFECISGNTMFDISFNNFEFILMKPTSKDIKSRGVISAFKGNETIYVINLPFFIILIFLEGSVNSLSKHLCTHNLSSVQFTEVTNEYYKSVVSNLNKLV
jgi:hypothetical protein